MVDSPYDFASDRYDPDATLPKAHLSERRRNVPTPRRASVIDSVYCHEDDLVAEFIGELKLRGRDDILSQNDRPGALSGMFDQWRRARGRRESCWASSDWSPDDSDLIANGASR